MPVPKTKSNEELGRKLLAAIERVTCDDDEIEELVSRLADEQPEGTPRDLSKRVIRHFSRQSAIVGGVTALPALLPGIGTATSLIAGPLADMVFLLKLEVELCLALSVVHGFDIRVPAERQLAFLLAALKTAEAGPCKTIVADGVEIIGDSVYHYAPRRVGKALVTVMAAVAAELMAKGMVRALPLIGVVVGASLNGALTARVGRKADAELVARKRLLKARSVQL